jgi:hypothetical protein
MNTLDLRCHMAQPNSGIGNVTTNTGLVEMAMAYSRSRVLCAAARLGLADALGDEVRSVRFLAGKCQAYGDALYRLLRALASIGVTEETTPEHFRLTHFGKPLRRDILSPPGQPSFSGRICLPTSGPCLPTVFGPVSRPLRSAIRKYLPGGRRMPKPILFFAP